MSECVHPIAPQAGSLRVKYEDYLLDALIECNMRHDALIKWYKE